MFKCAKISLSKLSLRREFKTLLQFSFACFKLLDSFSSKSDSEKLQHEVLPDNCQLKTFCPFEAEKLVLDNVGAKVGSSIVRVAPIKHCPWYDLLC